MIIKTIFYHNDDDNDTDDDNKCIGPQSAGTKPTCTLAASGTVNINHNRINVRKKWDRQTDGQTDTGSLPCAMDAARVING